MLSRLLAASSRLRFLRAGPSRLWGWASKAYFWPLMKAHPAGLLFPEKPVELVHALLGAIRPAEPDRPLPMQVADVDVG